MWKVDGFLWVLCFPPPVKLTPILQLKYTFIVENGVSVFYMLQSKVFPSKIYSWLSLSRIRLTRISGWVEFLSKSRTSLCINIYNLTPVESNSDESKFRLSRIKVLVPRCRKPYYLHSLSQIYLSKHVYYLRIKIGSQVKHPVIEFDIFTLGYFTCLFHNLSN